MPRTQAVPRIDGHLGDVAWRNAVKLPAFMVRSPTHGGTPRQATEVYLLYQPDALYLGIRLRDRAPKKIVAALGARDAPPNSDRITLYLDPLHTRRRGYYFGVTAAGIQFDGLFYGEQNDVSTWDAPWSSATRRDAHGWTAELRIPLTSLGYQDRPVQQWGFYIERYLQRHQEQSGWPLLPRFGSTFAPHFGTLEGLMDLKRHHQIRVQPYSAAKIQLDVPPGTPPDFERFTPNAGIDLRYSTGSTRFVLALNPDFGEVEQDPAVLNVSPNPVFFAENRPYFVAGSDLFQLARATSFCTDMSCLQPATLLYTRRIGAPGAMPTLATDGVLGARDPFPRIVGALKVLGEAGSRVSFAALATLVAPSFAREDRASGERIEHEVTPWTHYAALRGRLRIGSRSYLGAMGTGTSRLGAGDGYVGAIDGLARSIGGWEATGMLAASHAADTQGVSGFLRAGKLGYARWRGWIESEFYSQDFRINDLGFLTRADLIATQAHGIWQLMRPRSIFRDLSVELYALDARPLSQPALTFERYAQLNVTATFANQYSARSSVRIYPRRDDDQEMRGGPALPRPWASRVYLEVGTNASKALSTKLYTPVVFREAGLTWAVNNATTLRLWQRLTVTLNATFFALRAYRSHVDTLTTPTGDSAYLAGDLQLDQFEVQLSAMLGLHRLLTLRVFFQLLYGVGHYETVRELFTDAKGESAFRPTSYDGARDFSSLDLIGYAALRWDLGAGTAAMLVYKMASALGDEGPSVRFRLGDDLSSIFSRAQDHQLLLKISYAWGI
ncbi:MAG: carbohydrate binding family 9 domain-containing protein [Deltaproteobacteria bacterium]|nr:carbohydrate binding family 9 domain-containing protein [Deltaproteobacteria bacterium]